jgi:8-oxo-dGTP diphosphatase/2-hydroxy-dATP diphosphatase
MKKILTLCIVHQHPKVLLGMKKRGFGVGRWNGFGGKVEEDESIEQAAIRELEEESGIKALSSEKIGILNFSFQEFPEDLEMHIFSVNNFEGDPIESEEMKPEWFFLDEIPFTQMWSSDLHWWPLFLSGKKFKGNFLFDKPSTKEYSAKIIRHEIQEVDII